MAKSDKFSNQENDNILLAIYLLIRKQCNTDFTHYKRNTILRSIGKRMKTLNISGVDAYYLYLQHHSDEVEMLCKSFLISVTHFFRDKEAFDVIRHQIIPAICQGKANDSQVRLWVVGCCTGEEAFSLAILLKEYMDSESKFFDVKIFATDIDNSAIDVARSATYPLSIANDIPPMYLEKYFLKRSDTYELIRQIREMVVFSYHNIINNPPFSKIDLITCRNLLIYFQPVLQKRVMSLFQYAVNNNGFLFLGSSENVNKTNNCFKIIDGKWKIYKSNEIHKRPFVDNISMNIDNITKNTRIPENIFFKKREKSIPNIAYVHKKLIENYIVPGVIIDESNEIIQICGDVNKYLKIPVDKVSLDILKLVPRNIATAIGTAIIKIKKDKKPIIYKELKTNLNNETQLINLTLEPFHVEGNESLIIILFEKTRNNTTKEEYSVELFDFNIENQYYERISGLEEELNITREGLQNTLDEVAISSEELQSSNEELLVSNEELHSTNEELQSVNEELIIVNNQHQYTIQELTDLNNDTSNFIKSTEIGTLFLDKGLCVKKFTPEISKEINLIDQDIGRPIGHISHNLIYHDLITDALSVLGGLKSIEKEVRSKNGNWYIIKHSHYKTCENEICGVVISLIDISVQKKFEETLRNDRKRYELLVESAPFAIIIIKDGVILFSNKAGSDLFGVKSRSDLLGNHIGEYLSKSNLSIAQYDKVFPYLSAYSKSKVNGSGLKKLDVEISSMPVTFEGEECVLLFIADISAKIEAEQLQKDVDYNIKLLNQKIKENAIIMDFLSNISHEIKTPLNVIFCTIQLMEKYLREITVVTDASKVASHVNVMKQNCYRLMRLVSNFLDTTKFDSGYVRLTMQNFDIVGIIRDITTSVADFIKEKSIKLTVNTNVREKIMSCDNDSIERIMLNLLSNSIKFNKDEGEIAVCLTEEGNSIVISVKDTGIGIPENRLEKIFERFEQVDNSLSKNEGSGIGLSLVKSLVELHGGRISVTSKLGEGTEFIITMPVRIAAETAVIPRINCSLSQEKIEKIKIEFSDIYNLNL